MNCPVCDRTYDSGTTPAATLDIVKNHVEQQHPEYDPEWADD